MARSCWQSQSFAVHPAGRSPSSDRYPGIINGSSSKWCRVAPLSTSVIILQLSVKSVSSLLVHGIHKKLPSKRSLELKVGFSSPAAKERCGVEHSSGEIVALRVWHFLLIARCRCGSWACGRSATFPLAPPPPPNPSLVPEDFHLLFFLPGLVYPPALTSESHGV